MRKLTSIASALIAVLILSTPLTAALLTSGVSFSQVDFTYPGATQLDSEYGQAFLDYSQIPGSGYVNIETSTGWAVQNLPVFAGSGLPGLSMMFDLGSSGPQTSPFQAYVDYSPFPLANDSSIASMPKTSFGTLSHVEQNAEGGPQGLTSAPASPAGKMTTTFDPNGITSPPVINTAMASVEQDVNQCGPSAVANSLAYLNQRFGTPLPQGQTNIPGINGTPANSMVAQIDKLIPRAQGQGVWRSDLLDGKLKYLDAFGPKNLVINHQGVFDANGAVVINGNRTQGSQTSTSQGNLVTLDFLMKEIHDGEDVEMDLTYNGKFGAGHEIMVTGGDTILGRPWITFIQDAVQGDNTKGTGLFDGGYGFAWLDDPGAGNFLQLKGFVIGSDGLNAGVRNIITESIPEPASLLWLTFAGAYLMPKPRRKIF